MSTTQSAERAKKRPSRPRSEWVSEVRRWRQSGQTGPEYAQAHDLDAGTLAWWASRLRKQAGVRGARKEKPSPAFLAVQVRQSRARPVEGTFEVVLANGRCVRVSGDFDVERVSRLLAAAEGGSR